MWLPSWLSFSRPTSSRNLSQRQRRHRLAVRRTRLDLERPNMARYTDPNLNGWGLDSAPGGPFCVANTSTGVASFYDQQTNTASPPVIIPAAAIDPPGTPGSPTGVVYNPTSEFVISENGKSAPARFLFDTLDGLICGWNPNVDPNHAIIVVDNSQEAPFAASYTGLVMAKNGHGHNVLYAADGGSSPTTSNNRVDMFDGHFHSLGSFTDPNVVAQYPGNTAFQVEAVNNKLFVTFAGFAAPFGGVVDVFDTDGHLLPPKHFAANAPGAGPLDNPWGIVQAPSNFGKFSNDLLIGNVAGAGIINAFNPVTGAFLGPLTHPDGAPIAIAGLWDLQFGDGSQTNGNTNELFFTAGFTAETPAGNGLFGAIDTTPVTVSNNHDSGLGSLRDAIAIASSDDTIVFDPSLLNSTITLTSGQLTVANNLDIEGPGAAKLTISGDDQSRVFEISTGATVTIAGLTVAHGLTNTPSPSIFPDEDPAIQGGGILNNGGANLTLRNCTFLDNKAVGGDSDLVVGGALVNQGAATVQGCTFTGNQAVGGVMLPGAHPSYFSETNSGAIKDDGIGSVSGVGGTVTGFLIVQDSVFTSNQALAASGNSGSAGSEGDGGAITVFSGPLTITGSTFNHNSAHGGAGGRGASGGDGVGGAVEINALNTGGGTVTGTLTNDVFLNNAAVGGAGANGGDGIGGAVVVANGVLFGMPDDASLILSGSLFEFNSAQGGQAGVGGVTGNGLGGALSILGAASSAANSTFIDNLAVGGAGITPGNGYGGAIDVGSGAILSVTSSTITGNEARGGEGGFGGKDGKSVGGGVYSLGTIKFDAFTVIRIVEQP